MNIEIIPNWHPVFVHFTIGLLSSSTILLFSGVIFFRKSWAQKLLIAGHINLWLGAAFTCVTLLAGWQAYNTVSHDGPSHAAMTDHRNWALVTATLWMTLAVWAAFRYRKQSRPTNLFLAVLCTARDGLQGRRSCLSLRIRCDGTTRNIRRRRPCNSRSQRERS